MFTIILALTVAAVSANSNLEQVNDDELLNLVRSEKYIVVLFTKRDCEECDHLENALISIREDIVDSLNAWVVKAVGSQLVKLYSPSKEPALVYFRHGIPLLYDGEANDDVIYHTLNENKEPVVKELNDDNFEGLTQVATGATTGDWFIMFFRLGKMYEYNIPKYDVTSFVSFATGFYQNARAERVPLPKSPFDDFTQMLADYIRENPWLIKLASISMCLGLFLAFLQRLRNARKAAPAPSPPTEKKIKKAK